MISKKVAHSKTLRPRASMEFKLGLMGKLWVAHFERGLLFLSHRKVIAEAGNKWRRK